MASEEYKESDLSKIVKRLMDEEGFEFGEAVKEAMEQTKNFESKANGGSIGIEVLFGPKREKFNMGGGQFTSGGNISPGTDKRGNVRDDNPFTGGGGGGGGDGPPPVIISKDNTPEPITFNEITGKKMLPADLAIQKQFLNLVKKKGYESGLNTEADDLYAAYRSATGLDDFQTNALVNSTTNILDKEKDGVFETFVDRNSTITDLDTGKSTKQLMVETPTSFTRRTVRPSGIMENDIAQPFGAPQSLSVDPYSNIIGSKLKDGGRVGLFMGGPALTGPALGIYNSMKAYQSFTDQEIADAIKQAGYELPTADSDTTPPDSTPGQGGGGGGGGGGGVQNIIGGSSDTGYSPSQNVAEFQAYKDKINAEAMGSPFTSGPMVNDLNAKIANQMRSQNPELERFSTADIISMNPDMFNVGEVEDLSTFGKMKGSFNTGITSLMNSPFGQLASFAINPALAIGKGIIGAIPQSKPVGRVDGKAIYGVGSFDKFGTNAANQTALNKTGNFTNFQLGNNNDPGRVAGDPTKNVFAGMNAQSQFGDISKGAKSRIDTINANLAKGKYKNPAAKKAQVKTFEKQLADHNREKERAEANQKAAKDNQSGYGGSCFIAGTKVTMADGTLKNIEDVKVGDKVKGHKEENTVIKLDPTLLADRKLYSFNDNEHYFFTSEHPFMTEEGWKSIKPEKTKERDGVELYDQLKGELKVGDKLVTDNGPIKVTDIKSKEMNNPEMPLYNFNVSNDNSYIADDYVVHNKGCFLKGTLITMADGTTKPVEQVDLGDEVAVGGKVFAVGRFLNTELYDYKGIKVSGSHMVNEDGTWMRVRDTKHGKSLGDGQNTVYVFGSENRRILINDILFTDYFEIEDQEQLLKEEDKFFDNWKTFANNEDQKNVNTLNAN